MKGTVLLRLIFPQQPLHVLKHSIIHISSDLIALNVTFLSINTKNVSPILLYYQVKIKGSFFLYLGYCRYKWNKMCFSQSNNGTKCMLISTSNFHNKIAYCMLCPESKCTMLKFNWCILKFNLGQGNAIGIDWPLNRHSAEDAHLR